MLQKDLNMMLRCHTAWRTITCACKPVIVHHYHVASIASQIDGCESLCTDSDYFVEEFDDGAIGQGSSSFDNPEAAAGLCSRVDYKCDGQHSPVIDYEIVDDTDGGSYVYEIVDDDYETTTSILKTAQVKSSCTLSHDAPANGILVSAQDKTTVSLSSDDALSVHTSANGAPVSA